MSNGLGAGFTALTIIAILFAVSILTWVVAVAATLLDRRRPESSDASTYLLVSLGIIAVAVSGFGVVAFADEAVLVSWLLACLTVLPVGVAAGIQLRTTDLSPATIGAATTVGWGVGFPAGLAVTVATTAALGVAATSQGSASAGLQRPSAGWSSCSSPTPSRFGRRR